MLKIGFIGAGGIARNYRNSLHKLDGVTVGAVCDVDQGRARAAADEEGAAAYTDHRRMLEVEGLDAVFVCIPPAAHGSQVADIAEAGAAVFVAKPVAMDLDTAQRTAEVLARTGVVHQSGYMWRSGDAVLRARELLTGRPVGMGVGQVYVGVPGSPWWKVRAMSGGQVLEQSTHVVDLLRLFLGEVRHVYALGHTGLQPDRTDFEDCTLGCLAFRSGAVGALASTNAGGDGTYALQLLGRDLVLRLDCGGNRLTGRVDGEAVDYAGTENGYFRQVETFVAVLRGAERGQIPTDYVDAARTLAVTLAFNESMARGAEVPVPDLIG